MWKEYISELSGDYKFVDPATKKDIEDLERALKINISDDLLTLLFETNGVKDDFNNNIIFSTDKIIKENLTFRTLDEFKDLYMPFDSLLFIGEAGNGDLFAYPILNDHLQKDDIFIWSHEDDSRVWVALSLYEFLNWWTKENLLQ